MVEESLAQEIERLESEGIIAGARVLRSEQWAPGNVTVGGDVGLELYQQQTGLLFSHMFGAVATAGVAPTFTHTFTPGDLSGKAFTAQVGRPDVGGVVRAFTYAGCKVASWELAVEAGENATLGLTVIGMTETTATPLAVATFATDAARPLNFRHGAVTIAGAAAKVRALTVSADNMLSDD
ncbi:MAG: hypothetical protein GEV04_25245, partial [Actinophytocola sp.]|nr:hypothetical protein [Actinophytocola sp.]